MSYISGVGPKEPLTTATKEPQEPSRVVSAEKEGGPSVILRCKQWEDFQNLASQAQTLSFNYKEEDKVFQADALKGNRIITYSGTLPKFTQILKAWLSKELGIPEKSILEGVLAIG
jgi:hypothetical protein